MTQILRWLGWFFIGNALFFAAIGLRYIGWISPDAYQVTSVIYLGLTWLFIGVTVVGHFALLAFLPLLPVFLVAILFPKRAVIIPLACLVASCAAFVLITDTIVFAQYRFHLNGVILDMLFSDAAKEIFNFTPLEWFTAVGAWVILLALEIGYGLWLLRKVPRLNSTHFYVTFGTCLVTSYLMFLLSYTQPVYAGLAQHPQAFPLYNVILSRLLPIPDSLALLETAGRTQFAQPNQITKPLKYPLHPLQCEIPKKPLNVVMIVIDSWRFDTLNRSVTPNITQFSQQATRFMQHYSGGNGTQPGIFSLFYGLPATYWSAMLQQKQGPVFMQTLLNSGYQTGVFGSARLSNPPFDSTVFRDIPELALNMPGDTATQRDRHITAEFKHFIQQVSRPQNAKPFFGFLFYDAAHSYCDPPALNAPFSPAIKECNRILLTDDTDPLPYLNRYKNALYNLDKQVGEVLEALKNKGLLSNTVVILTSDHGEEFHDTKKGYIGHASNFLDYQVKVPLVVYWPKQAPQVVTKQTSHYDMASTLMTRVLGCKNPATDYSIGQPLDSTAPAPDYLQVTSYVNFGIRQSDRVTTVFRTGNFKVEDLQGKPLPDSALDKSVLKRVFEMMNKFYQ